MKLLSRIMISSAAIGALIVISTGAMAHGGRTNAEGCHNDRKNGGYHCHGGGSAKASSFGGFVKAKKSKGKKKRSAAMGVYGGGGAFANCSAARAAGRAPVRAGDAGYSRKLDRDGDGIGCE